MTTETIKRHKHLWLSVWRRNIKVWQKLLIPSLMGNFAEPLLYLAAIGYGLGQYVGEMNGVPYNIFLATGIICSTSMNTATFEGLYSAYTRLAVQKTWNAMIATPIRVEDIVLGELMWIATKTTVNASCILAVIIALGLVNISMALFVIPLLFLSGLCFGGMALIVTSYSKSYDFFVYYFTLIVSPMLLLSGVFFPIEALPTAVKALIQCLPLYHIVAIVRPLLTEGTVINVGGHLLVLGLYAIIPYHIAVRRIQKRLIN